MKKITSIHNKDSLLNFLEQTFNNISSNQIICDNKNIDWWIESRCFRGNIKRMFCEIRIKK